MPSRSAFRSTKSHHTWWSNWLSIAYSNERWLYYQLWLTTSLIHFTWKEGKMYFLNLGVKLTMAIGRNLVILLDLVLTQDIALLAEQQQQQKTRILTLAADTQRVPRFSYIPWLLRRKYECTSLSWAYTRRTNKRYDFPCSFAETIYLIFWSRNKITLLCKRFCYRSCGAITLSSQGTQSGN